MCDIPEFSANQSAEIAHQSLRRSLEIIDRDRHRCRRKGCDHTRVLHRHHLVPRAEGGGNSADNLITLCPSCHDLWHEKGGDLRALLSTAPEETA